MATTETRIERYRQCAAICAATEYGAGDAITTHNAAAIEMGRIAAEPGADEELLPLLDEPESAKWLAFQLLELCSPVPEVAERCLRIIEELAAGSSTDAVGAQFWLKEFAQRQQSECPKAGVKDYN